MNILITGSKGQLGSEIVLQESLMPSHTFFNTDSHSLDITDRDAVARFVEENDIDGIVNCAAYTAVDKAESDHDSCRKLNAEAPGYLADAISRRKGWLVQISTDYVFDGNGHRPYTETDRPNPQSEYGRTKLQGEETAMSLCADTMIVRTSWLYSSFGNNFVKTMIRLGRERSTLGVVFDQTGTPTYARDLASAILTAAGKGIVPGIYHFSNEGTTSWYDFAKTIHRLAQVDCEVRPVHTSEYPTAAKRPSFSVLDKTKIKQTYGISVPYWEDSLAECIKTL